MSTALFSGLSMRSELSNDSSAMCIPTPLGKVAFDVHFTAEAPVDLSCEYFEIMEGIFLRKWDTKYALIEALTIFFDYEGEHFPIDGRFAQVFRIYAKENIPEIKFQAYLINNDIYCESSRDPGEHIEALTFTSPKGAFSMGTDDLEVLNGRAHYEDWMPKRWKGVFDYPLEKYPFKFYDDGIETTFPEIYKEEKLQVSYVVSWVNQLYDPFNARLAVDACIEKLFAKVGLEY